MAAKGISPLRTILSASPARARFAHRGHPSADLSGRHAYGEFAIFFTWLTIRRQNDRLALPYDLGAQSMIPKKHAPDSIRGGTRFSEKIMPKSAP